MRQPAHEVPAGVTGEPVALGCVLPDAMLDLAPYSSPERLRATLGHDEPDVIRRALTLWQPWATLWVAGDKWAETRSTATKHRGLVAVHAAVGGLPAGAYIVTCNSEPIAPALVRAGYRPPYRGRSGRRGLRGPLVGTLHRGAVVGWVDVVDCVPAERVVHDDVEKPERTETLDGPGWVLPYRDEPLGDYGPGRWAWIAGDRGTVARPIVCKGSQARPWHLPEDVAAELHRQRLAAG